LPFDVTRAGELHIGAANHGFLLAPDTDGRAVARFCGLLLAVDLVDFVDSRSAKKSDGLPAFSQQPENTSALIGPFRLPGS